MNKIKKSLALLLAVVLVVGMMTACGKKEDKPAAADATVAPAAEATEAPAPEAEAPAEPAAPAEQGAVTLRINTMMGGTDPGTEAFNAIIDQFRIDNPTITVADESQVATEESKAAFVADFTLDNEPDVFQWFSDATSDDIVKMGKLVPVSEMQAYNADIAKDVSPAALGATKSPVDGVSYFIPTTGFAEGMFVNTDLFEANGLELPTDWDKFIKAIETFEKNGIIPIAISLNAEPHYLIEHLMLTSMGFEAYTSIPETASAEQISAIEWLKTLRDMNAFPKDTDTIDNPTAQELFRTKKAAMSIDGSWGSGGVKPENIETTQFIAVPAVPNGKTDATTGIAGYTSGFGISKKAWDDPAKKDACVKLINALTNADAIKAYWKATGAAICSVELTEEDMSSLNSLQKQIISFANGLSKAGCPTDARIAGEPWSTFTANAVAISKGDVKAEAALNEMFALYKQNNQ